MISESEVLVIGGGPTGCVIATMLAHQGHQVMLVSDQRREGGLPVETMVPGASTTLERLGLTAAMGNCAIEGPARHGRCWARPALEIEDLDASQRGWRFLRPEFDRWLRMRAREHGVEVLESTRALGSLPAGGSGVVQLEHDGQEISVAAKLVIAATGRASGPPLLPVETTERLPDMIALCATVESSADEAESSLIEAVAEGWLWWLPFGDGSASLALFCDPAQLRSVGRDQLWNSALSGSRGPARSVDSIIPHGTIATARLNQTTDSLLLAGDAVNAIDPLSSQGLEKALVSAESTALAARTILVGDADRETMAESRQRWERRLFRLHRQRAVDLYHAEQRFSEHPFWSARHAVKEPARSTIAPPTGRLTPAADLQWEPRWVADGDRMKTREGIRLADSDEESIDQIGSIPTPVLMKLVGDGIEMQQLRQRAAQEPFFIDQSPATLDRILQEMCRLGLLIED
ncbi:MAG: NAD(P)/FAD-dependent oxidoreductase [Planctomycetota bacterium]|nr:NAD(P)/FAD-dependent oxidoreductase [Planctomycetota bacterium]